jgi:hypothetical protein
MSKNSLATIRPVLLCRSVAALLVLSSPAVARGGGHHNGVCGEHHGGYDCGNFNYTVHHHRGHHEHHFQDHHRSEYQRDNRYFGRPERDPFPPDSSQGDVAPK